MENIHPKYDINNVVNLLFNFYTDIFILLIIVIICLSLITDEKGKGLFALIKATQRGTGQTIVAKLFALFILILSVHILIFGSTILFASKTYGLGDLSRAVQSLPNMIDSTLKLNLWQYILLYFGVKTCGLYIVGTLIFLIQH